MKSRTYLLLPLVLVVGSIYAQMIDFEDQKWNVLGQVNVITHMGRSCLQMNAGMAFISGSDFRDGTIEADFMTHGTRGFGGIHFRSVNAQNRELIYWRPHKSGLDDAMQYTPVFNGMSAWQLYSGTGYTAPVEIPTNRWIHIKIVVHGTRAVMYMDDRPEPALIISELKRGETSGEIGVWGSLGSVFFSNISFSGDVEQIPPPHASGNAEPGIILDYELSQVYEHTLVNESIPLEIKWESVKSESDGLLNISRFRSKLSNADRKNSNDTRDIVFARIIVDSDDEIVRKLSFGYSDEVRVYLNGQLCFSANSGYQVRDPGFLGIVNMDCDNLYLHLKKGRNEIVFGLSEQFGGWGMMARLNE